MKKLLGLGMCAWVFCVTGVAEPAQHTVYGSWGFDVAAMDTAVRPGDNFFRYVNGSWLDRVSIPPPTDLDGKIGASLGGQPAPVIDDYVRKQAVSDPHSPWQFRVNGVVHNIDAW